MVVRTGNSWWSGCRGLAGHPLMAGPHPRGSVSETDKMIPGEPFIRVQGAEREEENTEKERETEKRVEASPYFCEFLILYI